MFYHLCLAVGMRKIRMFSVSFCFFLCFCIFGSALGGLCVDCENEIESPRNKRIIYGTPLRDFSSYDVMGYFVRLSKASGWSWFWYKTVEKIVFDPLGIKDPPSPGRHRCGGALITPYIVQTACHCICKGWSRPPNWGPAYVFPIMKNVWEDMMILHHGFYRVKDFQDGVWSRKFIVHMECKRWNGSGELSHDFGMILTKEPLKEYSYIRVNFAPVYTVNELARQYYSTVKREAVCLFIGFGIWYFRNKTAGIYGPASQQLMHGWRSIRNYWECYRDKMQSENKLYGHTQFKDFHKRYYRDCTWSCHMFFGRHREVIGIGDSGGPVSCSDEYFGLNSMSKGTLWYTTVHSHASLAALAFNMYENAAEYRESMIKRFNDFADSNKDYPPDVRDVATIDPFSPDAYYHLTVRPTPWD